MHVDVVRSQAVVLQQWRRRAVGGGRPRDRVQARQPIGRRRFRAAERRRQRRAFRPPPPAATGARCLPSRLGVRRHRHPVARPRCRARGQEPPVPAALLRRRPGGHRRRDTGRQEADKVRVPVQGRAHGCRRRDGRRGVRRKRRRTSAGRNPGTDGTLNVGVRTLCHVSVLHQNVSFAAFQYKWQADFAFFVSFFFQIVFLISCSPNRTGVSRSRMMGGERGECPVVKS